MVPIPQKKLQTTPKRVVRLHLTQTPIHLRQNQEGLQDVVAVKQVFL